MLPSPLKTFLAAVAAHWRGLSLALVAGLLWCAHHDRWTAETWQLPTDYVGDAHEMLARIKAAAEGDTWPLAPQVIDRLAAPFGAHWNAYPTPDKPLLLFLGALANLIGVFAASNVGLVLAQITAALSFYFTARWLRCRWEWAWAGGLLFAYTYHSFHRGLPHFSFVFTWTVPLGLLAAWLVAQSRRLEWRSSGAAVCFAAALGLGVGNPYNLLFWGQLLGWALIAQWFGARRRVNLLIGIGAGLTALLAFALTNAELWLYVNEPEGMPLLARNYGGTERYALKAMEFFIPPTFHRWDWLAFFGHRYVRWSEWRGEAYLPYLGLFGVAGLIWLSVASVRGFLERRRPPGQALSAAWLVGYAALGGLTNILAFFVGFQVFRATNRVAIWISGLVLVFLVVRLSRLTVHWSAPLRVGVAMVVVTIGLFDQIPRRWPQEVRERMAADARSDVKLGRQLEAALPDRAMIFQIPVLGFPEVVPPHRLADYEHFRLYLTTTDLRFSYGAAKFRARSRWQRDVETLLVPALVSRLEGYGFSALYLNRKGYEDRGEKLLDELHALGYDRKFEGTGGQQVIVLLRPSKTPVLPLGRQLTFGQGWHPRPVDGVRWASDDAALSYFNPYDRPITADIRLRLVAVSERDITLELDGRALKTVRAGEAPVDLHLPELELPSGVNRFMLRSSAPAKRLGTSRYQLRTFGLDESTIKVTSEPGGAD